MNKILSLIGFAIKSKKYIAGQTFIKNYKDEIFLILVCESASNNLKDLAITVSTRHKCPVIVIKNLSELTHMDNIKIFAITDQNLSNGIITNKEKINID